jgi:hypothetical protein
MATTKKFAVAGYSTLNGRTKLRFANDIMRIKILAKNGHENLELVNLPYEMSKREIAVYMQDNNIGTDNVDVLGAIRYTLRKNPAAADAAVNTSTTTVTA